MDGLYDTIKQSYESDLTKLKSLASLCSFDFIGISFCNNANVIKELREYLGTNYEMIAKIETVSGIINLSEIVSAADAVMVARGDLFVEIAYQGFNPLMVERAIVSYCKVFGKKVIIGTRVADSLETEESLTTREYLTLKDEISFTDNELNYMLANETSFDENKAILNIQKLIKAIETLCNISD
ncbi:Pyruvate kinase [compost metagenome]